MSDLIYSGKDASGELEIGIYMKRARESQQHFTDFAVEVDDPDMILIGGGGVADGTIGAFLTASYPNDDLTAWLVSSKDHINPVSYQLVGYAIGLKVKGVDRRDLIPYIHVHSSTSKVVPHPEAYAPVNAADPGEIRLGGGFKVHWTGAGNLATGSLPTSDSRSFGWKARAKDHILQSPANVTTYAIGITNPLIFTPPGVINRINIFFVPPREQRSSVEPHPKQTVWLDKGYILTGGGADVLWRGAGNLLWKLEPVIDRTQDPPRLGFSAASKDHDIPDPSAIVAYVLGIKAELHPTPCR